MESWQQPLTVTEYGLAQRPIFSKGKGSFRLKTELTVSDYALLPHLLESEMAITQAGR